MESFIDRAFSTVKMCSRLFPLVSSSSAHVHTLPPAILSRGRQGVNLRDSMKTAHTLKVSNETEKKRGTHRQWTAQSSSTYSNTPHSALHFTIDSMATVRSKRKTGHSVAHEGTLACGVRIVTETQGMDSNDSARNAIRNSEDTPKQPRTARLERGRSKEGQKGSQRANKSLPRQQEHDTSQEQ